MVQVSPSQGQFTPCSQSIHFHEIHLYPELLYSKVGHTGAGAGPGSGDEFQPAVDAGQSAIAEPAGQESALPQCRATTGTNMAIEK